MFNSENVKVFFKVMDSFINQNNIREKFRLNIVIFKTKEDKYSIYMGTCDLHDDFQPALNIRTRKKYEDSLYNCITDEKIFLNGDYLKMMARYSQRQHHKMVSLRGITKEELDCILFIYNKKYIVEEFNKAQLNEDIIILSSSTYTLESKDCITSEENKSYLGDYITIYFNRKIMNEDTLKEHLTGIYFNSKKIKKFYMSQLKDDELLKEKYNEALKNLNVSVEDYIKIFKYFLTSNYNKPIEAAYFYQKDQDIQIENEELMIIDAIIEINDTKQEEFLKKKYGLILPKN